MRTVFDLRDYIVFIVKNWKASLLAFFVSFVIIVWFVFFHIEPQFMSSVVFLPPQSSSSMAPFLSMAGFAPTYSGIDPEQIPIIFNSKSLKKQVIEKFNLYYKYKIEKQPDRFNIALKSLSKDLILATNESGALGMSKQLAYTMNSYHTSADTAYMMVNFMFHLMDSTIREVSTDQGRKNKLYSLEQLKLNKSILDSLNDEMAKFQKKYKAYDFENQMSLTLGTYGQLNSKYVENQIRIRVLKRSYHDSYPEIVSLKRENSVLKNEMNRLITKKVADIVPGLNATLELKKKYLDMQRDIDIQKKLVVFLKQQYKEAELKEADNVSNLKVIDFPLVPEYKSRPKRSILAIALYAGFSVMWMAFITFAYIYKNVFTKLPIFRDIVDAFKKAV